MLHNGERLIREFFQVLSISCLQVYQSALLFAPQQTSLYRAYRDELTLPMKVHNASEETWNWCIRTMEGHFGDVNSVAFSLDGTRVVSGSSDNTIQLWDAVSGAHLNQI
jgi:WD40 repeat protein